jgi:hypothetical protein
MKHGVRVPLRLASELVFSGRRILIPTGVCDTSRVCWPVGAASSMRLFSNVDAAGLTSRFGE